MKKSNILIILTIVLMTGLYSCKKAPLPVSSITWFMGDVTIERAGEVIKPVLNSEIKMNDIIKTGEKSHIAIQLGDGLVMKLSENTTAVLSQLLNPGAKTINLKKGTIVSKAEKLLKDESFEIITPTAVAAVRGTTFSVSYDEKNKSVLNVAVSEGKVDVRNLKNEESIIVPDEKSITIKDDTDELELRKITEKEVVINKSIDVIPTVEVDEEGKFGESTVNSSVDTEIIEIDEEIEELQKKEDIRAAIPKTLEDIFAAHGRLDRIQLYNGKVIKGVILLRGGSWKVLIPGRYIYVRKNKVRNTSKIR